MPTHVADTVKTGAPGCWCQKCVSREIKRLRAALEQIAAYDDAGANERLAKTGSYSWFDEPASVQIAREVLKWNPLDVTFLED